MTAIGAGPGPALRDRAPRPRAGILEQRETAGQWRLSGPVPASGLDVDARELELWRRIDGERTVRQLVLEGSSKAPLASPAWTVAAIRKFAAAGLLEGEWEPPPRSLSRRLLVTLGGAADAPRARLGVLGLGTVLFVWLPLAAPLFVGAALLARGVSLMPPGADSWGLLTALLAGLVVRQVARAAACLSSGHALPAVGVELVGWIPLPGFEEPDLSDEERVRLAWWGVGSIALCAGLGAAGALVWESSLCDQWLAASLVLAVIDLGPIFPLDGEVLFSSWSGRPAALPRAAAAKTGAQRETRLTLAALGAALWALLAVRFGAHLYGASARGFRESMAADRPGSSIALGFLLVVAAVAGLLYALARLFRHPAGWVAARGIRGERAGRLMLPLGLLAVPALTFDLFGLTALAHLVALCFLAAEIPRLASEMRGSRLALGLTLLLAAISLQAAFAAPRMLDDLGLLDAGPLAEATADVAWPGLAAVGFVLAGEVACRRPRGLLALPVLPALAAALAALVRSGSTSAGVEAGSIVLAPLAALCLMAAHEASPMRHFWRPFTLAICCLAASSWAAAFPEAAFWMTVRMHVAGLLFLALAIRAARIVLAASPAWQAARQPPEPAAEAAPALRQGGQRVLSGLLDSCRQVLGGGRAEAIADGFGARFAGSAVFPLRFEQGEAAVPSPDPAHLRDAVLALRDALTFLRAEMTASAGAAFHDRALAAAAAGLGVVQWDVVRSLLLPEGPVALPWQGTHEELRRFPLFMDLSQENLEELVSALRHEQFPDGAPIVRKGEPGDRFYLVRRGKLAVMREEPGRRPAAAAHLEPGDGFGEMALLTGGARTATVVADGPVELASLGTEDFQRAVAGRDDVTPLVRHGALLQRVPLFAGLSSAALGRIASALESLSLADGGRPPLEGPPSGCLWLVKEGRLEVPGGEAIGPGEILPAGPDAQEFAARGPALLMRLPLAALHDAIEVWLATVESPRHLPV